MLSNELLSRIRLENLNVYRASPQRLREDVGQESQIAQDYRGRLIYELLQNADDAISGLHHYQTDPTVGEEALELQARQPLLFDDSPAAIGHRQLKDRLGQIHSHNRQSSGSIHLGLLLVALTPHTK